MKITLSKNLLLKNLQTLSGVLQPNHPLPILENFLFEITNGKLKITASDLESTMSAELDIESSTDGVYLVQARILTEILKKLPEQPLTFDFLKNNTIEIITETGNYAIAYADAKQYPKAFVLKDPSTVTLPSKVLSTAINKTIFAAGNDDSNPVMSGVYFQLTTNCLILVATDARKLVKYIREDVKATQEAKFIMPKKPLNVLKGNLSTLDMGVKVEYNDVNATFHFDNYVLSCRLIDGKYPNYEAVIPKENPNKLVIDRTQFLNSVSCVSVCSSRETNQVRLKISGSELKIITEDIDYSNKAEERLTCNYQGDDMQIGFNSRFLTEMLKNIQSSDIQIEMSQPNIAGILTPIDGLEDGEQILMLLMPDPITK